MTADGPKRRDSGQLAAVLGLPVHLIDETQVEILRHVAAATAAQTVDVRKALRVLQLKTFQDGVARGAAEAGFRLRELLKDVAPAWAAAVRELLGLAPYQVPTPTLGQVAAALRARRVVVTQPETRQLLTVMALPFVDESEAAE